MKAGRRTGLQRPQQSQPTASAVGRRSSSGKPWKGETTADRIPKPAPDTFRAGDLVLAVGGSIPDLQISCHLGKNPPRWLPTVDNRPQR